jgi:hypothetical protein
VAVILRKNSQYSTYRSIDDPRWPPSMADIVGHTYLIQVRLIQYRRLHTPS